MSDQRFRAIMLIGMPGVGKGTQGKLLGRTPDIFHISTGEILRSLPAETSEGRLSADRLSRGQFIPDDLMIEIWQRWLAKQIQSQSFLPSEQILLLDGIPRNQHQCQMLDDHIRVVQVIHLAYPSDDLIVHRLKLRALLAGRADDSDEAIIRQRLEVYRHETAPVLSFYPPAVVHQIDPLGSPAEVLQRIMECLTPIMNQLEVDKNSFARTRLEVLNAF